MKTRIIATSFAFGVALVALFSTVVTAQDDEAADEDTTISSLTPLRGLDMAVRGLGEDEFSEGTQRFPLEAFRDEDFNTLLYASGNGSVAAVPQPANFELRHMPFEGFYETIRFSPIAGVAWRLNLRTGAWQLIEEPEPLAPGDYDIDLFAISDASIVVMRIDRLTGQTWTMVSAEGSPSVWEAIAEPELPDAEDD